MSHRMQETQGPADTAVQLHEDDAVCMVDSAKRTFVVERWCFRGSIDDWIPMMGGRGSLPDLVRKYGQHLGKDSFYDLI